MCRLRHRFFKGSNVGAPSQKASKKSHSLGASGIGGLSLAKHFFTKRSLCIASSPSLDQ